MRSLRRILPRLALALAVALVALELAVRGLLFGGVERFREPWRYADADTDTYWALDARLDPPEPGAWPDYPDPALGWTSWAVEPETYAHTREPELAGRRPVLLFGDSFARCATPPDACFEGLLARSPLAADHALLNYGVGGYGLGQSCVLLNAAVRRHAARDPLVLLGILVDDDLERMLLSMRQWTKPRPRIAASGELVFDPPHPGGLDGWLADFSFGWTSFAWRRVVFGSRLVPGRWRAHLTGRAERLAEKRRLARALLAELGAGLRADGIEHFVVLFHGERALATPEGLWQERYLEELCAELDLPFVSSRRALEADMARTGRPIDAYFGDEGAEHGHYDALGNEVVFRAIERGIAGEFD